MATSRSFLAHISFCSTVICGFICFALLLASSPALAHFGMVIPETNAASQDSKSSMLQLSFSHPFEGAGMDLVKPKEFFALTNGVKTDLLSTLVPATVMDHTAWTASYTFTRPGAYTFVMEPQPYWEPEEDCFIIHYTKTIVAAFGSEDGWDKPVGLKTEIIPFTRPFGNYAGNSFTGQVLRDGKPLPYAEVEVEYYNRNGQFVAPTEYHTTQVVKADKDGIFSFTCPLVGWWGFAALSEADFQMKAPDGAMKSVELGAVLWIRMDGWLKQ